MGSRVFVGMALLTATSVSVGAETPNIEHRAVGCAVAERFPRMEAQFAPTEAVAAARIVFQPENTLHWYGVAMKREGTGFAGVLPQPKKELKAFQYYIEVTDRTLGTGRTANYTTTVTATAAGCQGKVVAGSLASASVLLEVPAGAATLPVGFASNGVMVAGRGAGAAAASGAGAGVAGAGAAAGAATAGAAAGGGGGIGVTALVLGGVAAAAGVGALVASQTLGSENTRTFFFEGHVYRKVAGCGSEGSEGNIAGSGCSVATPAPGAPAGPSPLSGCSVLAGAVVSTSLDSVTAISDSQGYFHLVTGVRETQCESNGLSGLSSSVTVSAPGCRTVTLSYQAGCHSEATSCLMHILMRCP